MQKVNVRKIVFLLLFVINLVQINANTYRVKERIIITTIQENVLEQKILERADSIETYEEAHLNSMTNDNNVTFIILVIVVSYIASIIFIIVYLLIYINKKRINY